MEEAAHLGSEKRTFEVMRARERSRWTSTQFPQVALFLYYNTNLQM